MCVCVCLCVFVYVSVRVFFCELFVYSFIQLIFCFLYSFQNDQMFFRVDCDELGKGAGAWLKTQPHTRTHMHAHMPSGAKV